MARRKKESAALPAPEQKGEIFLTPLEEVLPGSMLPYAEYVILDRALPRVEDGLKPVQRRILYTMYDMGLTPDKPHKKSARIVGECMGKYHPHGDSSVYDAMVRMAQDFNMRMTLVNGHGNFGSVDGDPAAAMRYTEARLEPLALELLRDIEKDTVRFTLNFDDSLKEPETLPGRFPNLLVNGASGIAVGLATNIPPHNLGEVIDGVVAYIDNPKIKLSDMMKRIPAPDFPTGGYIVEGELKQAYETGRGKITLRAKVNIEEGGKTTKSSSSSQSCPIRSTNPSCSPRSSSCARKRRSCSAASPRWWTNPTATACAPSSRSKRTPMPKRSSPRCISTPTSRPPSA